MSFMVFGHRGVPSLSTENSLSSFQNVLDKNIQAVELDVHLTKDKKLVVIHDFNTFKMSGESHDISETEYNVIKQLKIGNNEYIPLLSEVFDMLSSRVFYDLEIKSLGKNRKDLVLELIKLIKEKNITNNCFVSSFDPFIIKEFNKLKSRIPTGLIYHNSKIQSPISRLGLGLFLTKIDIIKPHISQLNGFLFFLYTKILKKKCFTWTVNTEKEINYAKKRGCLGVCTDYPQNFIP